MAAKTGTRPKTIPVNHTTVEHARSFFETLPEKTREELTLRQAVEQLKEEIVSSLRKGYSYIDLATMLTERGIPISAATLKNYVPSGRRQSSKNKLAAEPKARRPRKSAASDETAAVEEDTTEAPDLDTTQAETIAQNGKAAEPPAPPVSDEQEETSASTKPTRRRTSPSSRTKASPSGKASSSRGTGSRSRSKSADA